MNETKKLTRKQKIKRWTIGLGVSGALFPATIGTQAGITAPFFDNIHFSNEVHLINPRQYHYIFNINPTTYITCEEGAYDNISEENNRPIIRTFGTFFSENVIEGDCQGVDFTTFSSFPIAIGGNSVKPNSKAGELSSFTYGPIVSYSDNDITGSEVKSSNTTAIGGLLFTNSGTVAKDSQLEEIISRSIGIGLANNDTNKISDSEVDDVYSSAYNLSIFGYSYNMLENTKANSVKTDNYGIGLVISETITSLHNSNVKEVQASTYGIGLMNKTKIGGKLEEIEKGKSGHPFETVSTSMEDIPLDYIPHTIEMRTTGIGLFNGSYINMEGNIEDIESYCNKIRGLSIFTIDGSDKYWTGYCPIRDN